MEPSILSLIPPVLTILIAVATKQVMIALFCGVIVGAGMIGGWNPLDVLLNSFGYVLDAATDSGNMALLMMDFMIGMMVAMIMLGGGTKALADLLSKKVKTGHGSQLVTWVMASCIFFDDMFSIMAAGQMTKPLNDRYNVSREKLSYIIDSTSMSICCLIPVSSWSVYMIGCLVPVNEKYGVTISSMVEVVKAIPFGFYAWISWLMVLFVVLLRLDFGPMHRAEKRAQDTGVVQLRNFAGSADDEDDYASIKASEKGKAIYAIGPIVLLLLGTIAFMLYTGGFFSSWNLTEATQAMDGTKSLCYAEICVILLMMFVYKFKGIATIKQSIDACFVGAKAFLFVNTILVLAWGLGTCVEEVHTADYLVSVMVGNIPPMLTPLLIFITTCIIAFSTGASWATIAVMIPLSVPIALAMGVSIFPCIAAVLGGAVFGNHCSPIADTAILASTAADVFHMDHIKTQIPYSCTCMCCACVGYLLAGLTGNAVISLAATFIAFIIALFVLSNLFGQRAQERRSRRENGTV